MQISTRDQDWIVDTLKPWRHKLEVLNEVFADPSIVKVGHRAQTCGRRGYLQYIGFPRCIYGYGMASKRSRSLCEWSLRYLLRLRISCLSSQKSRLPPIKIYQFRCR
jgi:hypothetical protein